MPALHLEVIDTDTGVLGPAVSGSNNSSANGMKLTTYRSHVLLKECTVYGAVGSYTVKLFSMVGTTLKYLKETTFSIPVANTATVVSLNVLIEQPGDYWFGFDTTHGSLRRTANIAAQFPFEVAGIISSSGGTAYSSPGTNIAQWHYFFEIAIEADVFEEEGTAIYGPFEIDEFLEALSSQVNWLASVPEDTSLSIEAAIGSPDGWVVCENGEEIPGLEGDTDLYLRVSMETEDTGRTPRLDSLLVWYEGNADRKIVVLHMKPLSRFDKVVGPLKVAYNTAVGTLRGMGGKVRNFEEEFDPEDLAPKNNPNTMEYLTVGITDISIIVTKVDYLYAKSGDEYLTAGITDISIVVTQVGDNPL